MELGNEASYAIKGTGSVKFQLECGIVLHLEEVLYVPGLKKNLISVAVLENKGYRVLFMDGKPLLWARDEDLSSVLVIGIQKGGLYKLPAQTMHALVHSPSEYQNQKTQDLTFLQ